MDWNSKTEYVNVVIANRPVLDDVTEESSEDKSEDERSTNLSLNVTLEDLDEQDTFVDMSGAEYCNLSDFNLPHDGVLISDLPRVVDNIRVQPGGFEVEYKVRIKYSLIWVLLLFYSNYVG